MICDFSKEFPADFADKYKSPTKMSKHLRNLRENKVQLVI